MKTLLEKIDYSNPDNKHKMNDLFISLLSSAKEEDTDMYDYVRMELYEVANGKKITQDCADKWIQCMQPVGKHWTMEETTNVMHQMNYNFDPLEYYVVMNMIYNDYYDVVENDDALTCSLAKDWLTDADSVDDKLYEYWKYISKRY